MSYPQLNPISGTPVNVLPEAGTLDNVAGALPFGVYGTSNYFLSGAVEQVTYVYRKLGGDVLDIELTEEQVYAAYEEAVLEYSYLINIHQGKNVLLNALGATSGTFDHHGEIVSGPEGANLKFPKFDISYERRMARRFSNEARVGGDENFYSASFDLVDGQQDYDLQDIIYSASLNATDNPNFYNKVGVTKVRIRKVFYKSPRVMWRFYGYYGGIGTVGNLSTYGQYADDSTFEVIPTWQNKLQAAAYEDSIYTRTSQYSYQLKNNKLRLFPIPFRMGLRKMWVEFTIPGSDPWEEEDGKDTGTSGVNNLNSLPFGNIPFENINAIGHQWIRRFALSLCKEMLGLIRSKFNSIPIPGDAVTLNGGELITQAKDEQEKLRTELKEVLDDLTYQKLAEQKANMAEKQMDTLRKIPMPIYVG